MLKILVPVDASETSKYAIKQVIRRAWSGEALDVHLLHVERRLNRYQHRAPSDAPTAVATRRSAKALEPAGELLDRAGLRYTAHTCSGAPAQQIARYAETNGCAEIIMASTGLGSISEMLFGSVTAEVLRTSRIPVEVVPAAPRSRLRAYLGPTGVGAGIGALIYAVVISL
jgi:nucleotide-binding universal stress UspA family protein